MIISPILAASSNFLEYRTISLTSNYWKSLVISPCLFLFVNWNEEVSDRGTVCPMHCFCVPGCQSCSWYNINKKICWQKYERKEKYEKSAIILNRLYNCPLESHFHLEECEYYLCIVLWCLCRVFGVSNLRVSMTVRMLP